MHNEKQHREGRMRDEGHHAKHMREDGGVPITGPKGAAIHGKTTGEEAMRHTGAPDAPEMHLDSGRDRMKKGKPGDHQENS
jgi:hypothetical protein